MNSQIQNLKELVAMRMVKLAAGWISTGYYFWMLSDKGMAPKWAEEAWIKVSRHPVKKTIRLAMRIDKDEAIEQMVEEGWWG